MEENKVRKIIRQEISNMLAVTGQTTELISYDIFCKGLEKHTGDKE